MKVGVVGNIDEDSEKARNALSAVFDFLIAEEGRDRIVVVSGLTDMGIMKMAYEEADERGLKTLGIACELAYDYPWYHTTEFPIITGREWGDESKFFVDYIDLLVRINGGPQSHKEVKMMKELDKPVVEFNL